MRRVVILAVVFFLLLTSLAGADNKDKLLGVWVLKDNANSIKIIKEGDLYFVIEFVNQKHELFISGDGTRAIFIEYGKGPDWSTSMLSLKGNAITRMHFSEDYEWEPSQYVFYKKQ
ncbi:MAG: hypothetical protein CVV53_00220 [Spirochaetae bacterium HGW-Spirochaetae-9]|nr:MAG: hypothetical protein CVV53_00220 [Spirochaetae bacterium HGW-Spirochaetae-9]